MLENFGDYLRRRRKQAGYTQDRLAAALSRFSTNHLCGLDSVTISRWERATTEPTSERQKQVIRFFGDNLEDTFPFRSSRSQLLTPERSLTYLIRHQLSSPKLAHKVGSFPDHNYHNYSVDLMPEKVGEHDLVSIVLDYEHALYCPDNPVNHAHVMSWIRARPDLALVCTRAGHYFGHIICLPVKERIYQALINVEMAESELKPEHLARIDEPHGLYLFSFYGASRMVAALLILHVASYLSQQREQVMALGTLCSTGDGARLARAFRLQARSVGPCRSSKGLRFQGSEVAYVTFTATLKRIMSDNGLRRIISTFTH